MLKDLIFTICLLENSYERKKAKQESSISDQFLLYVNILDIFEVRKFAVPCHLKQQLKMSSKYHCIWHLIHFGTYLKFAGCSVLIKISIFYNLQLLHILVGFISESYVCLWHVWASMLFRIPLKLQQGIEFSLISSSSKHLTVP